MADVSNIEINGTSYAVKDATAARRNVYYGTCTTAANTYKKVATVETFPLDGNGKPLVGTVVAIKFSNSNSYKTEGQTYQLNVNSTGDYPMYYNNAALATSTSANTLVAGYKNRHIFYMFDGSHWVWLTASYDSNTTYSGMTQAEVDAGTGTTARLITPQRLRDNFYTETEANNLLAAKANSADLATVATSGSYNDLSNKPTIPAAVTVDSSLTGSSQTNPVQGGAIYSALTDKQDKDFIVTITRSGTYPNYTYTADKTAVQIDTAHKAGKNVIVKFNGSTYYLWDGYGTYDGIDGEIDYYFSNVDVSNGFLIEFNIYAYYESGVLDTETLQRNEIEIIDSSQLSSYVPTTRKINNKPLSTDITLTASDVGALPSNTDVPSITYNSSTTTLTIS